VVTTLAMLAALVAAVATVRAVISVTPLLLGWARLAALAVEDRFQPLVHLGAEDDAARLVEPGLRVPAVRFLQLENLDVDPKDFSRLDVSLHDHAW
jgi:hypothetical protein